MAEDSLPSVEPQKLVDCPECGESFAPRGIVAHRRMRHGLAPETATELAGTLSRIASALERLDARLSSNSAFAPPKQDPVDAVPPPLPNGRANGSPNRPPEPGSPLEPGRPLEDGIREVLAEIARVKKETERSLAALGDRAPTEEQKKLQQTAFQALATLRRRQADLLYRLQTGAQSGGIDALTTL